MAERLDVGLTIPALAVVGLLILGHPLTSAPATAALILWAGRRSPRSRQRLPRSRPALTSERGSVMVEVLIGTLLLALTTATVLNGIDGTQDTALRNKDRSVSATLAQQDLERLRSLPPTVLSNLDQTRTVAVAGVPYTVRSLTQWVRDASGVVSCTSDETDAEYLKLSATVTSPSGTDRPVTATSLLAPPPGAFGDDTGTATVQLTDRDGEPLVGVGVDLEGPSFYSGTTNDAGCAVFGFIPAEEWLVEVDGGLVTWSGETPAQSEITVAPGKTGLTQIELDRPASIRGDFVDPAGTPTQWGSISVANSKLPNGFKPFPSATLGTSKDADNLFPFHDGYGVFAGTCEANNPAVWDSDYFQTSGSGFAAPDPGELLEPVQVVVPRIQVRVLRGTAGLTFSHVQIYVKQIDDDYDCESVIYNSGVIPTGTPHPSSYSFTVPVPFGNYRVCAAVRAPTGSTWRYALTGTTGQPANPDRTEPPLDPTAIEVKVPTSGGSSGSSQCSLAQAP
jgi:hypothetical protein